jgi:hypothetical protein
MVEIRTSSIRRSNGSETPLISSPITSPHQADDHTGTASGGGSPPPPSCSSAPATANAPGSLMLFQVVSIQPFGTLDMRDPELVDMAVEGISDDAHARRPCWTRKSWVVNWIAHSTTRTRSVHALQPITRQLAETKGHPTLPHQEGDHAGAGRGGHAGGALPKSAGTSFHGRRKPNGSACQRRTIAGVQDEAKHATSAMSPLKSCEVEKPQPRREHPIRQTTTPAPASGGGSPPSCSSATATANEPGSLSAPRWRGSPVEEGSTQIVVDRSGS